MVEFRHWAYCPDTGEVLNAPRGCILRRAVKRNTAWDIKNGYPKKRWVFFHGTREGFRAKLSR